MKDTAFENSLVHEPVNLKKAQEFVGKHHRHSKPLKRHKFSIGCYSNMSSTSFCDEFIFTEKPLLGIVTVDNCSSAWSKQPKFIEIRRLCVAEKNSFLADHSKLNIISFLYSKALSAVFSMGYKVCVTYTRPEESGSSLMASGFMLNKATWYKQNLKQGLLRWIAHIDNRNPNLIWTKNTLAKIKQEISDRGNDNENNN